jgi:hypothetical protein
MKLSCVIVSWNTRELVRRCVESVLRTAEAEIIVSDNGSRDGTVEMLRRDFPQVIVSDNRANLGFSKGANRGIEKATGDYVLLLNSDTEINPDALGRLVRAMDENPRAAVVAPRMRNPAGEFQKSAHRLPDLDRFCRKFTLLRIVGRDREAEKLRLPETGVVPVEYVVGAVMLFRASAMREIGWFDESFFFYYEDTDICKRVRAAGRDVLYVPEAVMLHHRNASNRKNVYRTTRAYFSSVLNYIRIHHARERTPGFWVWFKLGFLGNLLYDMYKQVMGFTGRAERWDRLRAVADFIRCDLARGFRRIPRA